MKKQQKTISMLFSQTFGANGGRKKYIRIEADNNREPMIIFSDTIERLTTCDLKDLGEFLIEVSEDINNDNDLVSE